MNQDVTEVTLEQEIASADQVPEQLAERDLARRLDEFAVLLDIDGTLLDLAPTPREVWVPPDLSKTLNRLLDKTS